MAGLRSIILIVRNVEAAVNFYGEKLGLPVLAVLQDDWALIGTKSPHQSPPSSAVEEHGITIQLKQVNDSEASHNSGYSPVLSFQVQNMDEKVPDLLMAGASLDGAIKYSPTGKVANLRTPYNCGAHMISIMEPNDETEGQQPPASQQLR
jgi:catechol 2,3-dioxygenase-like lactoylglutathione lyase family enzyme